jgi:hypothetical protein
MSSKQIGATTDGDWGQIVGHRVLTVETGGEVVGRGKRGEWQTVGEG